MAYALEMATHPQTLYGIADSPVGLAAWMLDHDATSLALIARVFDGQAEGLTRDDVLDNITHYWLTNTGISSGRLYWENKLGFFDPKGVSIPVAVSVFPDELYQAPRSWAEQAYPNLIHYNKLDKGGHFAAWEQPQLSGRGSRGAQVAALIRTRGRWAARARRSPHRRRQHPSRDLPFTPRASPIGGDQCHRSCPRSPVRAAAFSAVQPPP